MTRARYLWRVSMLAAFALGSLGVVLCLRPIPQPRGYHDFADQRTLLGIPHFWNVVTNLPFLLAGAAGLGATSRATFERPSERRAWTAFFLAILLTAFGSAWYHLAPDDATLFWDRLPMTIAFSSILGIAILEHVHPRWGARLFAPLVAAGVASLFYARFGPGDLRFYGLLQGWAMAGVPLILLLFPARYTRTLDWFPVLGAYGAAKLLELYDRPLHAVTGGLGGHPFKHLAAAAAAAALAAMLARRRPRAVDSPP